MNTKKVEGIKNPHLIPDDMPEGILSETFTKLPMKEITNSNKHILGEMIDMVGWE